MKKLLLLTLTILCFSLTSQARGIPMPYCSDCEYTTLVEELPDSVEFYSEEYKEYVDLGYIYNQVWALWVPLWNSNGRYCYIVKGQDVYYDIPEEDLKNLEEDYGFSLSSNPIPFWDKIGGKLLVLLILGLILWGQIKPKS